MIYFKTQLEPVKKNSTVGPSARNRSRYPASSAVLGQLRYIADSVTTSPVFAVYLKLRCVGIKIRAIFKPGRGELVMTCSSCRDIF